MVTKRSKGYILYLYTRIKYKSVTVYVKSKTWKGTLPCKCVLPKNKQNKQRKEEWEQKKESYLNYITIS